MSRQQRKKDAVPPETLESVVTRRGIGSGQSTALDGNTGRFA
jgi:hypothetical protein